MGFFPFSNRHDVNTEVRTPEIVYKGFAEPNTLFRIIDEIKMTKLFPSRRLVLPVLGIMKHNESIGLALEEFGDGELAIEKPSEYVSVFISGTEQTIRFNPQVSSRPDIRESSPHVHIQTLGQLSTAAGVVVASHVFTIATDTSIQHPNPLMYPLESGPVS